MRWLKVVGKILTVAVLVAISLVMGFTIRSCQDPSDCSAMFWAQSTHMECPK